ncbi:hypothetical protein [Actinophytocola sp.]|uniref:hypothetical protein n=1 Tax=Actinophytocola sp. TaxID=1872138 RepID=UPI002D3ADD4A|nr:hypothetical protein [Actinophytocola sp.]HYQ63553.1 hypothetical protein [Actinophytocola sp.]
MVAYLRVEGTEEFSQLARDLKQAGDGSLLREVRDSMRANAKPIEDAQKARVQGIKTSTTTRGGASARAARSARLLGKRKAGPAAKLRAHRASGLREAAARTVRTQVTTGGNTASVRIRSDAKRMPADQQQLPQSMNRGRWRHPVFADREKWVNQTVAPVEWFDEPAERGGEVVREKALDKVEEFLDKI